MMVSPDMPLHALASRHMEWLGARQTVVARNIAQASTPGYRARDIAPFQSILQRAPVALETSHPAHFSFGVGKAGALEARPVETWETSHSRNSVNLDQEMLRAGEVNRGFALNSAVIKSFQKFWLAGMK